MRIFDNANFDFIGKRKTFFTVSAVVLLLMLATSIYFQVSRGSWLNYAVDFTGGTLVQVRISEETSVADLRQVIDNVVPGSEITAFGEGNEFIVRAPQSEGDASSAAELIVDGLRERYGENFEVVRTEAVGAKVGGELQTRALLAILLSFATTLIYLAFRFEWRFGLAAIIATAHDVLFALGFISVLQLDVALPTVAALLTILGYSLNDTIVVFDRVRENLPNVRREGFESVLNRSINETLPRTAMTSLTTVITLLALYLFGTGSLRDFALIMIVGIVIATYSSIFIGAASLLEIEKRWPGERVGKAATRPRASATA